MKQKSGSEWLGRLNWDLHGIASTRKRENPVSETPTNHKRTLGVPDPEGEADIESKGSAGVVRKDGYNKAIRILYRWGRLLRYFDSHDLESAA